MRGVESMKTIMQYLLIIIIKICCRRAAAERHRRAVTDRRNDECAHGTLVGLGTKPSDRCWTVWVLYRRSGPIQTRVNLRDFCCLFFTFYISPCLPSVSETENTVAATVYTYSRRSDWFFCLHSLLHDEPFENCERKKYIKKRGKEQKNKEPTRSYSVRGNRVHFHWFSHPSRFPSNVLLFE